MSLQKILTGTGVALVTPFKSNAEVDLDALGRVIDHVINGGVEYVVTLGTTGETPTLSKEDKIAIIQFTYEKVAGRVPVVVGVGGNDTLNLIKDLETFPLEKSVAVLSASPYYNKPSQEGIYQHYKMLAAVSPKPIILYNVPGRTGRNVNADTTIRLAKEVKNIAGIKEASGDMGLCMQILRVHRFEKYIKAVAEMTLIFFKRSKAIEQGIYFCIKFLWRGKNTFSVPGLMLFDFAAGERSGHDLFSF